MTQEANDWLLRGGVKSASYRNKPVGHEIGGPIVSEPVLTQMRNYDTNEPEVWKDGSPKMQLVVTVQTNEREDGDDDGLRAHYISGNKKSAVVAAIRKSGAKGLEIGGYLSIAYTGDGEQKNPKLEPPKLYSAVYTPPTSAAQSFLATPEPAASPWGAPPPPVSLSDMLIARGAPVPLARQLVEAGITKTEIEKVPTLPSGWQNAPAGQIMSFLRAGNPPPASKPSYSTEPPF